MNTRRGFIGKSIAAIAAMLGVGKAAAAGKDYKLVRGVWPAEAGTEVRLERKDRHTDPICLSDLSVGGPRRANEILARLGAEIEGHVEDLVKEGATQIQVRWVNILSSEDNPLGLLGHFYIRAYRVTDGSDAHDFVARAITIPLGGDKVWQDISL